MTPKEKLTLIESKIKTLNDNVFHCTKWKLAYENKGANNYCVNITLNKKTLQSYKFDTYGSVLSVLDLMLYMFSEELRNK